MWVSKQADRKEASCVFYTRGASQVDAAVCEASDTQTDQNFPILLRLLAVRVDISNMNKNTTVNK